MRREIATEKNSEKGNSDRKGQHDVVKASRAEVMWSCCTVATIRSTWGNKGKVESMEPVLSLE